MKTFYISKKNTRNLGEFVFKQVLVITAFAIVLFCSSCEALFLTAVPKSDNAAVFDTMWNTVNSKYSMFEFKNIDWQGIRTKYRPSVIAAKNDEELFAVLASTLNELRDDHVNIATTFNRSAADNFYFDTASINFLVVRANYLQKSEWNTRPLVNALIQRNGKTFGYIRYASFAPPLSARRPAPLTV